MRPTARCWFINSDRTLLIQVQNGRFIQNWRKEKAHAAYPRYNTTRQAFHRDWERFTTFLQGHELGDPVIEQCEITYVNHLELGEGWNTLDELAAVTPAFHDLSPGNLPTPEALVFNSRFVLPDQRGRLYVQIGSAVGVDGRELLQLSLTARGAPKSSGTEDILSWFDLGRNWIHEAFEGFVTSEMRRIWGGQRSE
jgi:uncharacterized protein (TIGR04255 family)